MLGNTDFKTIRLREYGDIVKFMAVSLRGGMWLTYLKVSGGISRANPYGNQELHFWSQPIRKKPVLCEGKRPRSSPNWIRKTTFLIPYVRHTKRRNIDISIKTR
jgi:hypothetical protein